MTDPLLAVDDLSTAVPGEGDPVQAVDGVSFEIDHGETVCLVGESGSGKTLTCDSITGLSPAGATLSGTVQFDGHDLLDRSEEELCSLRGDRIGYVFQNVQGALDPVYTIGDQIVEAITFHREIDEGDARQRAIELLDTVELSRPADRLEQYPHELSDGMCQRVGIAIGLAAEPDLLIADEPTSALDVTTQARIIELLETIQSERELSVLLVTHDLRVVSALGDRVVVLYDGVVVERGPLDRVFERPGHPYTHALFESFLDGGDTATAAGREDSPTGCRFRDECPHEIDACAVDRPELLAVADEESHEAACIFHHHDRDSRRVLSAAPELDDGASTPDAPARDGLPESDRGWPRK